MKSPILIAALMAAACAIPASAQFTAGGSSHSSDSDTNGSYSRLTLDYAPTFIGGQTVNGVGVQFAYGTKALGSTPLHLEFGLGIKYGHASFDGPFGSGMLNAVESLDFDNGDPYDLRDKAELISDLTAAGLKAETKFDYLALTVPVNLTYRWAVGPVILTPRIGINFKFNLLAKGKADYSKVSESLLEDIGYNVYDYSTESQSDSYKGMKKEEIGKLFLDEHGDNDYFDKDDMGKDYTWKRFQMGWQIGAGVEWNHLYFGIDGGTDFINIAKDTSSSSMNLSLGYVF